MSLDPSVTLPMASTSSLAAVPLVDAEPPRFDAADERAMRLALDQAQNAWLVGEVPVGAVILRDDADGGPQVIATGYNRPITTSDPTAHAELVALRHAAQLLGNYRLPECTLVVTLEPCAMCAMALIHARFKRVVFGARDPKTGAAGSVVDLFAQPLLNHHTSVSGGCLDGDCARVLREFFAQRRAEHRARQAALRPAAAGASGAPGEVDVDVGADVEAIPVGIATESVEASASPLDEHDLRDGPTPASSLPRAPLSPPDDERADIPIGIVTELAVDIAADVAMSDFSSLPGTTR